MWSFPMCIKYFKGRERKKKKKEKRSLFPLSDIDLLVDPSGISFPKLWLLTHDFWFLLKSKISKSSYIFLSNQVMRQNDIWHRKTPNLNAPKFNHPIFIQKHQISWCQNIPMTSRDRVMNFIGWKPI